MSTSAASPVTLFLCGDIMTGRGIDQILTHPSDPRIYEAGAWSAVEYLELAERAHGSIPRLAEPTYIWGDALAELDRVQPAARIVNLETSVTTSDEYERKGINYRMHPANVDCLKAARIDCCTLANNHILDWGRTGLRETLAVLHDAGIHTAGAGRNRDVAEYPAILNHTSPRRILVFAAAMSDSGVPSNWAATLRNPGVWFLPDYSAATVRHIRDVIRASGKRPGDIVVFSLHWGDNWGYDVPSSHKLFARRLIDSSPEGEPCGVDIVYGHSSHHPKGFEIYNGRLILYGCGDFLNDYEGITGREAYRGDLTLMYFPTIGPEGDLQTFEMTPLQIRRFRLAKPSEADSCWMEDTLRREAGKFGVELHRSSAGTIVAVQPRPSSARIGIPQ